VVVTALLAGTAHAGGDFCFTSLSSNPGPQSPNLAIVGQGFKIPKSGKCRPIVGWEAGYHELLYPRVVSGMACLDSAGTILHMGATVHPTFRPGVPILSQKPHEALGVSMDLPYPALTDGIVVIHRAAGFDPAESFRLIRDNGVAGPCFGNLKIPIP
jgi:hypothetical protein